MTDAKQDGRALTPQQRGAAITNSGQSPLARLSEAERKAMVEHVMDRYLQDGHLRDIAKDLGVARTSLNQAILKYANDDWQSAQAARALGELDDAENEMALASDAVAVSRAREQIKSAQWKLERVCKRLYSTQPEPAQHGTIAIQINFAGDGAMHSVGEQAKPDPDDT